MTLCLSEDEWRSALASIKVNADGRWLGDGAHASTHFYVNTEGDCTAIVCVDVRPHLTGPEIAALLVHEAVHIWQDYCRRIGESNPGDEQEAYAIQYLSKTLIAEMARRLSVAMGDPPRSQ
jgi:hypothetical protein